MAENTSKSWERPWTPQEMIENSSEWSLAGDAGLLKYLEQFSDKFLSKAKETNDRLDNLAQGITEAHLTLANVHNEFMGLHNTQFIESRVYEEDETLPPSVQHEKEIKQKPTESERLEEIKQTILNGLEIVDQYYEKIEIPASDSEDETDEPSAIFQPVDPYANRPLPYVIGSADWHKYIHVGLVDSSSEEEVENKEYVFSDSNSEDEEEQYSNMKQNTTKMPEFSDSESDVHSSKETPTVIKKPSNVNEGNDYMFESSSESDTGSAQVHVPSANSFAAELAAKLGKVELTVEPEINKKPIQKPTTYGGGLFSDEPPPLDEEDVKPISTGLFSGGEGLFDDDPDDSDNFWAPKANTMKSTTDTSKPTANLSGENVSNKKTDTEPLINPQKPKKQITGGLFDEDDDDDGGLFSTVKPGQSAKQSLFNNDPPEIEQTVEIPKKKLPGVVSPFGANNSLLNEVEQAIKKKETKEEPERKIQPPEKKKIESIFNDDSPLFSDDIFSNTKGSKLFDSDPKSLFFNEKSDNTKQNNRPKNKNSLFDEDEDDPLFSKENTDKIKKPQNSEALKKQSLFSDSDDLFKQTDTKINKQNKIDSLFSSESDDLFSENFNVNASRPVLIGAESNVSSKDPLFSPDDLFKDTSSVAISKRTVIGAENTATKSKKDSLFSPETDDLFGKKKSTSLESEDTNRESLFKSENNDLFGKKENSVSKKSEKNIFNEDDDLFITSSNIGTKKSNIESEDIYEAKSKSTPSFQTNDKQDDISKSNMDTVPSVNISIKQSLSAADSDSYNSPIAINADLDKDKPNSDPIPVKFSDSNVATSTPDKPTPNISVSPKPNLTISKPASSVASSTNIFSNEPPPLIQSQKSSSNDLNSDYENDLFKNTQKSDEISIAGSDFGNDFSNTDRKLSAGRIDLFSDSYNKNSHGSAGLFDWEPPELEQPPPLSKSNDRLETKKSVSSLFSDEEDLFDTSSNYPRSLWNQEPPPLDNVQSKFKEPKSDLFADEDIFGTTSKEILSSNQKTREDENKTKKLDAKSSLFPENNLFSSSKEDKTKYIKEDLFANDKNEEDLFTSKLNTKSKVIDDPLFNIIQSKKKEDTSGDEDLFNLPKEQPVKITIEDKQVQSSISSVKKSEMFSTQIIDQQPFFDEEINQLFSKTERKSDSFIDDVFASPEKQKEESDPLSSRYVQKEDNKFIAISSNKAEKEEGIFSDDDDLFKPKIGPVAKKKEDIKESIPTKKLIAEDKNKSNISSNIFSDEEDLIKSSKNQPKSNTSLFSEDSDDDLFSNKTKSQPKLVSNSLESKQETSISTTKIKNNLNINVQALLPGAAPKKKTQSPEKKIEDVKKNNEEIFLDSPVENTDILTSTAKQRVRIPVKRRPSTRRARQEAIRKSGMEFNFEESTPSLETPSVVSPTESEKNIQNVVNNNPTTSENLDTRENKDKEINQSDSTLFKDNEDIFKVKKKQTPKKQSLFDDEDDDDDIFSNVISKPVVTAAGTGSSNPSRKQTSRIKKLTPHSNDTIISDPLDVINK